MTVNVFEGIDELVDIVDPNLEDLESILDHVEGFSEGLESIISNYRENGFVNFSGAEKYTVGVFKANSLHWNVNAGYENFVTDGLKKLWEMIKTMCSSIWNFFFGKNKDDSLSIEDDVKVINKAETVAKNIEKTGNAVLDDNQIIKAVKDGIDDAVKKNKPKEQKQIPIVSVQANDHALTEACEKFYHDQATEVMEKKIAKVNGQAKEVEAIQKEMKENAEKAARGIKDYAVAAQVTKELNARVFNNKKVKALINRISAPLDVLINLGNEVDSDKEGKVLIESQFCMPGGSFWFTTKRQLDSGTLSFKNVEQLATDLEKWLAGYTRTLEKFEGNSDRLKAAKYTDNEIVTMLNNSRKALKAFADITAAFKANVKQVKNLYQSTFKNFEQMKAKRIAVELSKLG